VLKWQAIVENHFGCCSKLFWLLSKTILAIVENCCQKLLWLLSKTVLALVEK
jgi:hypothetical protein